MKLQEARNIKRCYISGKITGTDDYMKRFADAEVVLKAKGFEPVNPARVCAELPNTFTHGEYMAVAMACLEQCGSIYMLTVWQDSNGATMEHQQAKENGLLIGYEDDVNEFNNIYGSGLFTSCSLE